MLDFQIFKSQGLAKGWLFKHVYFSCMAKEIFWGV